MYWEVMRRAGERGCPMFDFGRSKIGTGAYAFKKNWGFEPEPLALSLPAGAGRADAGPQPAQPEIPAVHRGLEAAAAAGRQRARPASSCAASAERRCGDLLFLAHRIPYPPDKGEKIRAWHMLQASAARTACISAASLTTRGLASICPCAHALRDVHAARSSPRRRKLRCLAGTADPAAADASPISTIRGFARWVDATLPRTRRSTTMLVYSSAMAPY